MISLHKDTPAATAAVPALPLPNDEFDGGIVIASCWGNDAPDPHAPEIPIFAELLVLMPAPPFYRLFQIEQDGPHWHVVNGTDRTHPNIIPAAEDYSDSVGGY